MHDIAAIWVASFSRCQRYRCGQVLQTIDELQAESEDGGGGGGGVRHTGKVARTLLSLLAELGQAEEAARVLDEMQGKVK